MAYVLGFFAADGNMVKTKRGTHFIAIQITDKEIVHAIRDVMDSEHAISKKERFNNEQDVYRLQIGSKEIFEDLLKLGFLPSKTKRLVVPIIPKKYFGDFVRGYFDGDGNVWVGNMHKNRKTNTKSMLVSFTSCSYDFLQRLHCDLKTFGIVGGSLKSFNNDKYSRLTFSTLDALKIYKIMYNGTTKLFLERKKIVFDEYIELRP